MPWFPSALQEASGDSELNSTPNKAVPMNIKEHNIYVYIYIYIYMKNF